MFETKIHPADIVVIAAVLVTALLLMILPVVGTGSGEYAVIRLPDGTENRYPLSENRTIELSSGGYTLTVTVENGTARVLQADCPGEDCRKSGAISRVGDAVVCVPAGIIILIDGADRGGPDGIAG